MNKSKQIRHLLMGVCAIIGSGCANNNTQEKLSEEKYEATWESLSRHEPMPDWLYDGKFGLYFTWGVYTVPQTDSEWYPRTMYERGNKVFEYHKKTYGDQSEFGYHHFVPMFKAPKFQAKEWADLIKDTGAKFAGPIAEHHDGFSMWASKVNPWNAYEMGPNRDIVNELRTEITKQGLKFLVTFHHARNLQRNAGENNGGGYDSHFIYDKNWHTSSTDPRLKYLYGNLEEAEFNQLWFDKLKEVIDGYSPDLIYFDSWLNLIPESYRQEFCAYFFNHALQKNQQVGISYKQNDLPVNVGIHDIEKGGHMEVFPRPWMTDDTMCFGSWSYTSDLLIKPASMVLHSLIDIVSKNGVLLLNGSPKADGSFPEEQKKLMREIGTWLKANGEAIYKTRPWWIHGGGPTMQKSNPHGGMLTTNTYTAEDYRFTQSKDGKNIYVIFLGQPDSGKRVRLREFAPHRYPATTPIKRVTELSTGTAVKLEETDSAFFFTIPDIKQNTMAMVLKIELE
ncbi:MAG: alpha-L-fucosidase [Bacteroidales bacterium]